MRIAIVGTGVISAMGVGRKASLEKIVGGGQTLGAPIHFSTNHDALVAEVKYSNEALKQSLGLNLSEVYSRTALLGMMAAEEAMQHANLKNRNSLKGALISATSVGGMDMTERFYPDFMTDQSKGRLRYARTHDCGDSTSRIAEYCGIGGFSTTISTACSSAANAIMMGARLIRQGLLDYAVVGGTDALCKFTLNGFHSLKILDRKPCRPFDKGRVGLNLGEGAGFLVLAKDGLAGVEPLCFLSGYANANDAYHQTATSPNGEGAFRSMSGALKMAGLDAAAIDYVNTHGTGTVNNDASELAALIRLFGAQFPLFSSTKPFTGHTLAAAGGIEAVLSVLSIQKGIVYPNLNFAEAMEEGFIPVSHYLEEWPIRNVMSNSFGFGGNCSTLIFSK